MLEKIKNHKLAVRKLELIKDKAFRFIRKNIGKVTESEVKGFILSELKKESMLHDKDVPIVGVNQSSAIPHYFPKKKSRLIRRDNLVLIDIWARIKGGYFADITWMGYSGKKIPKKIKETFNHVVYARDLALKFIRKDLKRKNLPRGFEVDEVVRNYFKDKKIEKFFIHGTGHSLGIRKCHGWHFKFRKKNKERIKLETPFTIEPGIYYKRRFGVRSEIDGYIDRNYKLVVSGKKQGKIVLI